MEIERIVAVKHRQHMIGTSFITQQEPSTSTGIVQSEASRLASRSSGQLRKGRSRNKVEPRKATLYGLQNQGADASSRGCKVRINPRGRPDAAYKCPVRGRLHSYTRNMGRKILDQA